MVVVRIGIRFILLSLVLFNVGCLFDKKADEDKKNDNTQTAEPLPPPPPPPLPQAGIQCERTSLSENAQALVKNKPASVSCSVTLSLPAPADITVNLDILGSATSGSDYSTLSKQVLISKDSQQSSFTITTIDDSIYEPSETITIQILPDSLTAAMYEKNAALGSVQLAVLDDELQTVSAYLSASDYWLDEANPSQQITWTIEFYDDNTGEPIALPFDLNLTPVSENKRINIAQRLTSEIQNVVVPKNSTTYSFSFGIVNDQIAQPIQSDSVKLVYEGVLFSEYTYLTGFLNLYDDELPAIKLVTVSTSSTENGGTTVIKAVSNANLVDTVQIPLTYSGTAIRGVDYRGSGSSDVASYLTINAGTKESATTSIVLIGDGYYEGSEYFSVAIGANANAYSLGSPATISISVTDDVSATPDRRSIEISATTQSSPASISLDWTGDGPGATYKVYRKLITDASFPNTEIASIAMNTYTYTDTTVSPNIKYEYKVERASGIAIGYVATGIDLDPVHDQGGVLLVVESAMATSLDTEINQWIEDLTDEGYSIRKVVVNASDSVVQVKNLINQEVANSSGTIKAVALFGHVPVPYSGSIAPDGHSDHNGAWPADGYYGDLDTQNKWTDTTVNNSSASRAQNRNTGGDGKFDQSSLPLNLQLQVGRVDLSNLPAFAPLAEVDLLRRYLDKNHKFRKKINIVTTRALFDDNWGNYGGGDFFGTSMWRSVSPIVGKSNIVANNNNTTSDWFTQLRTNDYLFAYGGGAGSYNSVSGIGTTNDFAAGPSMAVFTALFGSYFGDWDSSNNVLRAPLAAEGLGLTCVWSGRPEWYFHHMAIGESVGFAAKASMNNISTYPANIYGHGVHMALMGDPTLKAYVVAPATQLVSQINASTLSLDWTASTDTNVDGYYVYKSSSRSGPYTLVTTTPVTGNHYDTTALSGTNYYMVRATKRETTPSGGFRNLSSGVTIQVNN